MDNEEGGDRVVILLGESQPVFLIIDAYGTFPIGVTYKCC